jgi:hypothetical protein
LELIQPTEGEAEVQQIEGGAEDPDEIDYKCEYYRQVDEIVYLKSVIQRLNDELQSMRKENVDGNEDGYDGGEEEQIVSLKKPAANEDEEIGEEQTEDAAKEGEKEDDGNGNDGAKVVSVEEASHMINTLIEKSSLLKPIDDDKISSTVKRIKKNKRGEGEKMKTTLPEVKISTKDKNTMDLGNEDEIKDLSDWTKSKYFKLLSVEEQFVLEQYLKDILDGR